MVYVAVAPLKTLGEELLKKAASLAEKEIADTSLLLAGELPKIIARFPDAEPADSLALKLRNAGLKAFVCTDSELQDHPAGLAATFMVAGEKEEIFLDRRGREVRIEADDAFLIIRGTMQRATQEKTSVTKMKLNVPATVLTGGLPIMRRVTRETIQESFQAEGFVRIYDRKSSNPLIEMLQNSVDYAFLGPELTPSTPVNFKMLVTKLRKRFPLAVFDDRLTRRFKADVSASGPGKALEINCKLIYLCQLAMERSGDSGT
jgi:hypothetical protein